MRAAAEPKTPSSAPSSSSVSLPLCEEDLHAGVRLLLGEVAGQAEVGDPDVAVLVQQDVGGLHGHTRDSRNDKRHRLESLMEAWSGGGGGGGRRRSVCVLLLCLLKPSDLSSKINPLLWQPLQTEEEQSRPANVRAPSRAHTQEEECSALTTRSQTAFDSLKRLHEHKQQLHRSELQWLQPATRCRFSSSN